MIHDIDGYVVCWTKGESDDFGWYPKNGRALNESHFCDLPVEIQADIIALIAEVSEKSYRRGVQQGSFFRENEVQGFLDKDIADWRFNTPPGLCPNADNPGSIFKHAVDRVLCETPQMRRLFADEAIEKSKKARRSREKA